MYDRSFFFALFGTGYEKLRVVKKYKMFVGGGGGGWERFICESESLRATWFHLGLIHLIPSRGMLSACQVKLCEYIYLSWKVICEYQAFFILLAHSRKIH